LIGRKIRLFRQVTNLMRKRLKNRSVLRRYRPHFGPKTRFSLYLASPQALP
jgi:hypothetical protein